MAVQSFWLQKAQQPSLFLEHIHCMKMCEAQLATKDKVNCTCTISWNHRTMRIVRLMSSWQRHKVKAPTTLDQADRSHVPVDVSWVPNTVVSTQFVTCRACCCAEFWPDTKTSNLKPSAGETIGDDAKSMPNQCGLMGQQRW